MAGIQIYTESPISPAVQPSQGSSADGERRGDHTTMYNGSPSATAASSSQGTLPSHSMANASSSDLPHSHGPSHSHTRPEISLPTPTATSAAMSSHEPTLQQSSTTTSSPPSPQPGALPTPSQSRSRSASPRRDIPPPPKVGEKMQPASYYSPAPTPTYSAPQGSFPTPAGTLPSSDPRSAALPSATGAFAGQNGLLSPHPNSMLSPTRTYGSPAQTPTTATMQQKNLEHPPGYVQNPYAADLTPEQRFATQHGASSPSLGYNDNNATGIGGMKSPSGMFQGLSGMVSPRPGGGILNGDGKTDDGSYWGMVSGWAKGAGKKLSEVEGEVWRRINGE